MIRRASTHVTALLALSCAVHAAPALARASSGETPSGGTAAAGSNSIAGGYAGASSAAGHATAQPQPGKATVSASGNGITFGTRQWGLLRSPQRFTGNAGSRATGDRVEIERRGRETDWRWAPTAHAFVAANGSFTATWPVNHIGQFAIRAVLERGTEADAAGASPALTIIVYRPSVASWYGPGMFGTKTACGVTLQRSTLGVANKTLRCGTPVALYYHGRTIVVPVIDRGPYAPHRDWDLTEATSQALGVSGVATIGAVSLPGTAVPSAGAS